MSLGRTILKSLFLSLFLFFIWCEMLLFFFYVYNSWLWPAHFFLCCVVKQTCEEFITGQSGKGLLLEAANLALLPDALPLTHTQSWGSLLGTPVHLLIRFVMPHDWQQCIKPCLRVPVNAHVRHQHWGENMILDVWLLTSQQLVLFFCLSETADNRMIVVIFTYTILFRVYS